MFKLNREETSTTKFRNKILRIQKRLVFVLVSMVLLFITAQFVILSVVGVKGDTLSQVKSQQEEQRLDNEVTRAKILDSNVSTRIKTEMESELNMSAKTVKIIDSRTGEVVAQK